MAKTVATMADGTFTNLSRSPDGGRIAAFELAGMIGPVAGEALPNRNPLRYRLVIWEGTKRRVAIELTGTEEPPPGAVAWLADGTLAARMAQTGKRTDWFAIRPDGTRVNLTRDMEAAPPVLAAHPQGDVLVGASAGRLWKLSPGSSPEAMTDRGAIEVVSIAFPESGRLIVRGIRGGRAGWYAIDPSTGSSAPFPSVEEGAEALAVIPQRTALVVSAAEPGGGRSLRVRSADPSGDRTIATINRFTEEIEAGSFHSFPYRTRSGGELTAWVLLPPGHREGARLPTVVSVYPGLVYSQALRPRDTTQSGSAYNAHLFAAQGYAVLFPSIPLSAEGTPDEPYERIREGVMPALEEAVRLGLVDGGRVAAFGHSFGGYAALALATQTQQFRAIIACSGFANLSSLYGAFDPRFRYDATVRDRLLFMVFAESGQFRLGSPPWADAERYARNSPISFVDRVTTPVMIIQGDQDYVPIQQGEEFFTALFRQGKEAAFVRYWGEGHVVESPSNIRDMWDRMTAFLAGRL